jgi:hypothetical protein
VYFRIATKLDGTGAVPDSAVAAQIAALNAAFNPWGFRFNLAALTRHANDSWYDVALSRCGRAAAGRGGGGGSAHAAMAARPGAPLLS